MARSMMSGRLSGCRASSESHSCSSFVRLVMASSQSLKRVVSGRLLFCTDDVLSWAKPMRDAHTNMVKNKTLRCMTFWF